MKQKITQILIGLFFLFGFQNSSAQWNETKKNLDQKSREEFINKYSDRTLKQLSKMISAEDQNLFHKYVTFNTMLLFFVC